MWRWVGLLVLVAAGTGSFLWWQWGGAGAAEHVRTREPASPPTITLQPSATAAEPVQTLPPPAGPPLQDSILVSPCNLLPAAEQDVASQIEGVLEEVAVDLGQPVERGQLLGRLDDRQVRPQVELLQIKAASRSAELIAKAMHDEADAKVRYADEANKSGLQAVAPLERQTYLCQRERYAQEMAKAREERQVAEKELDKARQLLALHELRSGLTGEVVRVYKRPGEAVKPAEAVFRVASFGRLRVEGLCKLSQARLIRVGMRAIVEPEVRSEPRTRLAGHTGAVHALAVSADGRLLASAGDDRMVILWDWSRGRPVARLPHPAEAHAVAFVPATGEGYQVLTGCADGKVRRWRVSPSGRIEGPTPLPGGHEGTVRALAVRADGVCCASAGEDRRLGVWDLVTNTRRYWVRAADDAADTAHKGAVTAVHFTPDGRLVSAGRDNELKLWQLGAVAARLVGRQAGRTGDVGHPGVSPDGRCVLFDHGEELRLLGMGDWSARGTLHSGRQGQFQGVAVFAPSGKLVLAGASNGRLQLWRLPAEPEAIAFFRQGYAHGLDRSSLAGLGLALAGNELAPALLTPLAGPGLEGRLALPRLWALDGTVVRHFLTPNAAVTCAVFAPDGTVAFSGGTDKVISVWPVPPEAQWSQPLEAEITFVASQVERGTDMVRLRAEVVNPTDPARRLRPGTFASLRLYPEAVPEN
jgi:WD40 repeat protein